MNTFEIDFSIITPSYGYGHFIGDCLESVARQEGITLEHLVMDAVSEDNTSDIVASFSHATLYQEKDSGMSEGINKGFRKAKGKWLMWLNADDRLKLGTLRAVRDFSIENPDADVIYGAWNFINHEGSFLRKMTLFPFDRRMLVYDSCYLASTACFYRKATTVDQGFLLDEKFRYCMDGEYYARLSSAGKRFRYLPRVLAEFRLHGASISQGNLGKEDLSGILGYQHQQAEPRTIRRFYGLTPFKSEHLNNAFDFITFLYFRTKKQIMRRWYSGRTIED